MKRRTFLNMLTLCCVVFAIGSMTSAQDAKPQKTEKVGQPAGSDAVTPPVAEADEVAMQADEMRELVSQPLEKLNEQAREWLFEALVKLGPGRELAKWSAREKNFETERLELLAEVERAKRERDELRTKFESEMAQIRERFADDETEFKRQLWIVIRAYKPRLLELKEEEVRVTAEMGGTDEQLKDARRNVAGFERNVRLAKSGIFFRTRTSAGSTEDDATVAKMLKEIGIELDPHKLDGDLDTLVASDQTDESGGAPNDGRQNQNVQQAMAELETLFKE